MTSSPPGGAHDPGLPPWLFPTALAAVLALHAVRLFGAPGLHGGGDLLPHLRMIELMREAPALRNVYPPGYHAAVALLASALGTVFAVKAFSIAAAGASMLAFRFFQRSAGLPDAASLLYLFFPYHFTLSWNLPKAEVAGYALVFLALAFVVRRRWLALALVTAGCFWVHTASALLLGLAGGTLALARREPRALVALAAGAGLGAVPLVGAHLAAGCTLQQALLFAEGDYLHVATHRGTLHRWPLVLGLASPPLLGAALAGAPALWRWDRSVAVLCTVLLFFYLQELFLAPFRVSTTVSLLRGLSLLALPASVAAGVFVATRRRWLPGLVAAAALWGVGAAFTLADRPLFWRPIALDETRDLRMARCRFAWNAPHAAHRRERPADLGTASPD